MKPKNKKQEAFKNENKNPENKNPENKNPENKNQEILKNENLETPKNKQKDTHKNEKLKKYKRFTFTEISYHWAYAVTFMPLLITGMIMVAQKVFALDWVSKESLVTAHKYIGISFIIAPFLVALAGDWRIHLTNLIEALTWKKIDFLWIYRMTIQSKDIPEAGKFNPGQKINMLLTLLNYFAFAVTGLIMWLEKGALSAWYIHIILFVFSIPMIAGHLFLAMINRSTRPGFPGIFTGKVPLSYVTHHHSLVLKEKRKLISLKGFWKIFVIIPALLIGFVLINIIAQNKLVEEQVGNLNSFNKTLVMPGELILSHKNDAKTENCYVCHELSGRISNEKCLDCHEKIQTRMKSGKGYHAKFSKNCIECHSDHHGEDYKAIVLDQKEFNHRQALFSLLGKHQDLKCEECHKEKSKNKKFQFIGITSSKCTDCHQDQHNKQFKQSCDSCHNENGWKKKHLNFDHKKNSEFPLLAKHKNVSCNECHKKPKRPQEKVLYKGIKHQKCNDCHEVPHKVNLKEKCTDCHNEKGWKIPFITFKHEKSKFPLKGIHKEVSCKECHKTEMRQGKKFTKYKLDVSCTSCHKDQHKKQFKGKKCTDCHNENGWKIPFLSFKHKNSKFVLKGFHKEVSCKECHKKQMRHGKKIVRYKLKTSCISCHKDQHNGQFKGRDCTDCHNENGWKIPFLSFKHKKSNFPLQGIHKEISCKECHKKQKGKKNLVGYKIATSCISCHKDQHNGQFRRQKCTNCHDEKGWKTPFLKFEHEAQSTFKIRGKHNQLECSQCHKKRNKRIHFKPIVFNKCSDCHEDIHRGMNRNCTECHNEKGWSGKELNFHHKNTKFPLRNDHVNLECNQCHKQKNIFTIKDSSCESCHQDYASMLAGTYMSEKRTPDYHYDVVSCQKCHNDANSKSTLQAEKICSTCHTSFYEKLYFNQRLYINKFIRNANHSQKKFVSDISKIGSHNFRLLKKLISKDKKK